VNLKEAEMLLPLPDHFAFCNAADVRSAFAYAVRRSHPDTGQEHGDIAELQQARDLLLEALESQKYACKLCQGVGKVRNGMAWRDCSACRGKGETR
jgi:hypothetical protein